MLRSASEQAPAPEPDRWRGADREPEPRFPEPAALDLPADDRQADEDVDSGEAWQPDGGAEADTTAAGRWTSEPDAGPRIEPWSPDSDPWRVDSEPEVAEPPASAAEPAPPAGWPPRSDEPPDWLAEPPPRDRDEPSSPPEPESVDAEPVEAAADEPDIAETPAWSAAEAPDAGPVADDQEEGGSSFWSRLPWLSTGTEPETLDHPRATPEPEREPQPQPQPEPEPQPDQAAFEAAVEPERETASDASPDLEPELERGLEAASFSETVPGGLMVDEPGEADEPRQGDNPRARADLDVEWLAAPPAGADEAPDQAVTEAVDDAPPEPLEPAQPAGPWADAAEPADRWDGPAEPAGRWDAPAEPADPWGEPSWPDRGDATRVLPTSWSPPPPSAPDRTGELEPVAGPVRTSFAEPGADADVDDEPAPSTAEQAVPWLIGVILLLGGMVIVLLALIFAGDASLGGSGSGASPSPTLAVVVPGDDATPTPGPIAAATQTPAPTSTPEPSPTPADVPQYGPLEMVYQGRAAALAPIYLLRRDFTIDGDPAVLAQDASLDVRRFAWAPDGTRGAGLLADVLVSIEPGTEKRRLGDGLTTITFGGDADTIYAVRITQDGGSDVATVLVIDFASGDTDELASVNYPRPSIDAGAALREAQLGDDGGPVRLFWMEDGTLRLWALQGGTWRIDPDGGEVTELDDEALPVLWSPDARHRISLEEEDGTTRLRLRNENDRNLAETTVTGLVSHVRWSPGARRVVFTVGRSAAGGGVLQDLFLWDLADGAAPTQLTSTGAAFGAEWLGSQPLWRE